MLRLRESQVGLFDAVMPPEAKLLSDELAAVDALLDDDQFLAPFVTRFWCPIGRPTIPIETYLRLMYLKHRHGLGYETLVKEVADSLSWRRFCRLGLTDAVPHSTTLLKLTRRFGSEVVEELNQVTLRAAVDKKLLRSRRLRVDCTAMEADVRYPTDSGLCAHAISRIGRAVATAKAVGLALRTRFRNRRRSAAKVARKLSLGLGRPGSKDQSSQAPVRAEPDAPQGLRRCPDLGGIWRPGQQPGPDGGPRRVDNPPGSPNAQSRRRHKCSRREPIQRFGFFRGKLLATCPGKTHRRTSEGARSSVGCRIDRPES